MEIEQLTLTSRLIQAMCKQATLTQWEILVDNEGILTYSSNSSLKTRIESQWDILRWPEGNLKILWVLNLNALLDSEMNKTAKLGFH
jgi:hypothetical protein